MSDHLYPTLIADGSLSTQVPDNHSTLQDQITSEVDKYLQEVAERHERDVNYFDGWHVATNTSSHQQKADFAEHDEEDGLDLLLGVRLCVSLLMHAEDVANTSKGVLDSRASLTLITTGGCLAVAQNLSIALAGLHILLFAGDILLLVGGFGFTAGFLAIVSDLGLGRA